MQSKVFFGWWLLAGLFIAYAITNGVVLNTLPIFYPALIAEFGWTEAEVTQPAQLLFLVVALSSPFIGILLDRYGAKRVMVAGGLAILLSFGWFARMQSLGEMLGIYILFSLGITAAGIIPSMRLLTNWFERKRGIAVGILLVGSSLGGAIFNQIAGSSIAAYGWRTAMLLLGLSAAVFVLAPIVAFVRNAPADLGLLADGAAAPAAGAGNPAGGSLMQGVTFSQALRAPNFYLLLFITGAMWFCIVGVIQHQALYFKDLNTSISAKDVLSLFFLSSILGKLLFGWLSDRFSKKMIMLAAVINLAVGAALLVLSGQTPMLLWAYAIVFGIGFSGTFTMIQLLVAEFYAGLAYGKILGLVIMVDTLAGVLGIMALGQLRTSSGVYTGGFQLLFIIAIIAAVCVLLLKNPRRS